MAENKEGQEKTEPATAKRLNEARMRGQVAKSMDVTTAAVMLFGGLIVFILGHQLMDNYREFMRYAFYNSGHLELTYQNITGLYYDIMSFLAKSLLPILLIIFVILFSAEVSQVGLKIATKKFTEGLMFKQIFNPFVGLKKIFFSGRSLFELVKSIAKILLLGVVVYWVLEDEAPKILHMLDRPFSDIAAYMAAMSLELVVKVGVVYIIIAVADFLYQKYRFKEDMKMTKYEVKEEGKQAEGDPKVKARLRQIMRQRIRRLMMQNVEQADVVITNPTHFAVALEYKTGEMNAPKVVAKGVDFLAIRIMEIASKQDIPVVEQPPLARAIYFNVEVEQEIPEDLFKAVAQVLAYVYQLKKRA